MQCEFDFETEITVSQAEAGDLWPLVAAASDDPETAIEEGEACLVVSAVFDGHDGYTIDHFEASDIRINDMFAPAELAYFIEKQMREKRRAELNEYAEDPQFFDAFDRTERFRAVHRAAAQRNAIAGGAR